MKLTNCLVFLLMLVSSSAAAWILSGIPLVRSSVSQIFSGVKELPKSIEVASAAQAKPAPSHALFSAEGGTSLQPIANSAGKTYNKLTNPIPEIYPQTISAPLPPRKRVARSTSPQPASKYTGPWGQTKTFVTPRRRMRSCPYR